MVVKSELEKLGLHHTRIELGEAEIMEDISTDWHCHIGDFGGCFMPV
jgi:hypothetical protein